MKIKRVIFILSFIITVILGINIADAASVNL